MVFRDYAWQIGFGTRKIGLKSNISSIKEVCGFNLPQKMENKIILRSFAPQFKNCFKLNFSKLAQLVDVGKIKNDEPRGQQICQNNQKISTGI
jgi:hypothetical protein